MAALLYLREHTTLAKTAVAFESESTAAVHLTPVAAPAGQFSEDVWFT
ncbi:hypothetical protein GCM10010245_89110 [Streptomyces spectabilis]|nr:hypothetical protein GCM10010245_89110 [Streptomyces spectabilis]